VHKQQVVRDVASLLVRAALTALSAIAVGLRIVSCSRFPFPRQTARGPRRPSTLNALHAHRLAGTDLVQFIGQVGETLNRLAITAVKTSPKLPEVRSCGSSVRGFGAWLFWRDRGRGWLCPEGYRSPQ